MRVLIIVLVLVGLPALAQAESDAVARELAGIRVMLEKLIEYRDVDVVLQRIALEERRIQPIERRMSAAEGRLRRFEEELRSITAMAAQTEERIDDQVRRGVDNPDSEERRTMGDIERTRGLLEQRIEDARYQVALIEAELLEREKAIEDLDARLLDLLERR